MNAECVHALTVFGTLSKDISELPAVEKFPLPFVLLSPQILAVCPGPGPGPDPGMQPGKCSTHNSGNGNWNGEWQTAKF